MKYRNFPMVPRVVFGRGSFDQLDEILEPKRKGDAPMIYFVDHVFEHNEAFKKRISLRGKDEVFFVDTTHEPKTKNIDQFRDRLKNEYGTISGTIGIGGGSVMDTAKAVALMMTNPGSSADYQGWDLVKNPAVYHVGIPTISGTGAEVARTAVLTGPEKKLGINSDFTPFDQLLLDPELIRGVPVNQRFYTGMDCFIHCVESLNGTYLNAFSKSYGEKSQELCEKVYLGKDVWDDESDDDMMMASFHGGMSIAYSQVGVAHATSYGLAFVLGTHHGIGNSITFNQLEEFYPDGVAKFKKMIEKWHIDIPKVCVNLTEQQYETMIKVSLGMAPLWENALGKDWKSIMTPERLRALYEKM
jgi:3-deoxy-alpha-D-manno-octulosonate 8-oxidase